MEAKIIEEEKNGFEPVKIELTINNMDELKYLCRIVNAGSEQMIEDLDNRYSDREYQNIDLHNVNKQSLFHTLHQAYESRK